MFKQESLLALLRVSREGSVSESGAVSLGDDPNDFADRRHANEREDRKNNSDALTFADDFVLSLHLKTSLTVDFPVHEGVAHLGEYLFAMADDAFCHVLMEPVGNWCPSESHSRSVVGQLRVGGAFHKHSRGHRINLQPGNGHNNLLVRVPEIYSELVREDHRPVAAGQGDGFGVECR